MKTQSDRTLFFDLLPLDLGEIMGFKTRFLLYTVPGQVFYNATRKLVLKGADAIVFVADSEVGKMDENKESLSNLRANLTEYGLRLDDTPWVIQYNKRDLPRVYTVEELNAALNPGAAVPFFEAVATQGTGVFETFRGISQLLMEKVTRELRRAPLSGGHSRAAKAEEAPAPSEPTVASLLNLPAAAPPPLAAEPAAGQAAPFQYGRELSLPDFASPRAGLAPNAAAVSPPAPALEPVSQVELPSVAPARFTSRIEEEIPAPLPTVRQATPERPAVRDLVADLGQPRAANVMERATPDSQELVVPLKLPRQGSREIVLRIVLSEE
jgi:signal recognition particle receptor subunit beta